ncbi:hypothetical protein E5288_WYG018904 [Bos mutus]|uniref:Uncharacterized protein n=1 Tax=Bos mutus TaxID=72004 RepID=A0A6B0RU63_9CETA|nr:hypothetical protein [Bos mutus]
MKESVDTAYDERDGDMKRQLRAYIEEMTIEEEDMNENMNESGNTDRLKENGTEDEKAYRKAGRVMAAAPQESSQDEKDFDLHIHQNIDLTAEQEKENKQSYKWCSQSTSENVFNNNLV